MRHYVLHVIYYIRFHILYIIHAAYISHIYQFGVAVYAYTYVACATALQVRRGRYHPITDKLGSYKIAADRIHHGRGGPHPGSYIHIYKGWPRMPRSKSE